MDRQGVVMNKLLLGSFALALTMGGSAAMAADMPLKAPPPPPVFSWTGCYVGIEGGGAWGRSRHDNTFTGGGILGGSFTPYFDTSGGLAGVEYGCNQQFGNFWVFGIEGDWSWTSKRGSSAEVVPFGIPTWTDETRERWISTSRARVGWAWDRAWLYVTGGFAAARIDASVTIPVGAAAGTYTDRKVLYGWTVGAGLEYAFWYNWSLKGEYLYVRLENREFFDNPFGPVPSRGGVNVDNHIVRLGLNWRFTDCAFGFPGGCAPPPAPVFSK
jgi:outer membrane immunogenic protein